MRSAIWVPAILLCGAVLSAADGHYDLGGPCQTILGPRALLKIQEAKRSGSWERVIELEKQSVREGCGIAYRWESLADTLVQVRGEGEAIQVLEEMDSRGFNLNASSFGTEHAALKRFVETPAFQATAIGAKIEGWKRISDERRAQYREILRRMPDSQKPPENYVAKGACPFECCQYRQWSVLEDTDLVDSPGSTRVVGRASKGSRVIGITGEVHVRPEPVVVVADGAFSKGSIVFLLDYMGEGYMHIYTQGKVVDEFAAVSDYCFRPSAQCWGESLFPASKEKSVWWVKVRLADGRTGWSVQEDHFGDKDACG